MILEMNASGGTLTLTRDESLDLIEKLARTSPIASNHGTQVVVNYVGRRGDGERTSLQILITNQSAA